MGPPESVQTTVLTYYQQRETIFANLDFLIVKVLWPTHPSWSFGSSPWMGLENSGRPSVSVNPFSEVT